MSSSASRRKARGAVTVLAVLGLMVVLGAAALAVDLSMLMAARTQLAIAADAAALAGVKELPFGSRDRARTRAVEYAARNEVLGAPVTLELGQGGEGDVELGYYDFDHHSFQPEDLMPNAVRVTARRTGERAVPTFFAAVFGRRHVDVWTRAVAVSYPRTVVVTFDRSASMDKSGAIGPARNAAAEFLEGLALSTLPERMGLVAYASTAAALSPILGLHDPGQPGGLVTIVRRIEAAPEGEEGGTNTGQAIERATELFSEVKPGQGRDGGQRMIVLLSDGLANRGRRGQDCHTYQTQHGNVCWRYAVEAAAEAHAEGIVVHTITLGDAGQIQQMREIAEAGGHGLALFAPTPAELDEMFDTLARSAQVALVN